jgi:hypothetical protein
MMKLQGTSFNLDAVKDQIAKAMKRDALNESSTGPEGIKLKFGFGNIPRGPCSARSFCNARMERGMSEFGSTPEGANHLWR